MIDVAVATTPFLDITFTGLEAIPLFPEDGPYVIFCTAHAEHALAAFDTGAIDYLLKPVEACSTVIFEGGDPMTRTTIVQYGDNVRAGLDRRVACADA